MLKNGENELETGTRWANVESIGNDEMDRN